MTTLTRLGLVVHPSRDVSQPLSALEGWARERGVELLQIHIHADEPRVAPAGEPGDADVVVAIGGDGTVLGALRAAAPARRAVVGVACGSLGALAAVTPGAVPAALDRVAAGEYSVRELPALEVRPRSGEPIDALNDLVVVRAGAGQVQVAVALDGVPYARWAGDGLVIATPIGSSAYTMAAGGPLLAAGVDGLVLTPLSPHGGSIPSIVGGAGARWDLEIAPGHGGARVEMDGQPSTLPGLAFQVVLREGYARLIRLGDEEAFLVALRRRGIIADSPRALVDERLPPAR